MRETEKIYLKCRGLIMVTALSVMGIIVICMLMWSGLFSSVC